MKITFLGTGGVTGLPEWCCDCEVCSSKDLKDFRTRSAIFIETENKNSLVDFSPDLKQQILKFGIKKIDYAFLTRAHGDHMNDYMQLSRAENLVLEMPQNRHFFQPALKTGVSRFAQFMTFYKSL